MKQVLVLCIANSCRSQMAEGYLRFYGAQLGRYQSISLYPTDAHLYAIQVMAEDNIDIKTQSPKSVESIDNKHFDYILFLDNETETVLPDLIQADQYIDLSVPDPAAFTGNDDEKLERFRQVRELIKAKILKFIGQELIQQEQTEMVVKDI